MCGVADVFGEADAAGPVEAQEIVAGAAVGGVFLRLFRKVRIGWRQVRRGECGARQEEHRREGQRKSAARVRSLILLIHRKVSLIGRYVRVSA